MRPSSLFLIFAVLAATSVSFANVGDRSLEWIKTTKSDGMAVTYVHKASVSNVEDEPSAVSIYRIPAQDPEIVKFHATLEDISVATVAGEYAPTKCFRLNRKDLSSRQTWCEASPKWFVVVAELGSVVLPESDRVAFAKEIFGEADSETKR